VRGLCEKSFSRTLPDASFHTTFAIPSGERPALIAVSNSSIGSSVS
jgi:hypothetical protein